MFKKTQLCTAVLAAFAGSVYAQEAQTTPTTQAPAAQAQRVEITGSRIRTVDTETAQPVQVITQEQIQKSGLVTVGDIIGAMAAAGSPDISKGAVLASGADVGGQYVNLRNLGAQRLLILVDGKRWSQSVSGLTDVSTIPSSMIERIETLKDGASSIYGSDAIAGVINFILKKRMEGGEISLYTGINSEGDGRTQDFSLSYGASGEKTSLMFGVSYSKQEAVWAKDREITSTSFGPELVGAGFGTGPWGRIRQINPANGLATGFNQVLNHTGTYDGVGVGSDSWNQANYHTYAGAEEDLFNSTQQMMFTAPVEMKSMFTRGTMELTDTLRFTATAMFADRQSSRQVAGYPLNSASQPNYKVYVDKDSYYNPYGNQGVGIAEGEGQDLFFYRRTIEVPRVSKNSNKTLHFDAGLNGELDLGGKFFNWDVGYNYSKVDGTVNNTGNLNLINLKKALGPSFMNSQGVVQCGTAAAPIPLSNCVPFNILGGPSASTSDALNYVMANGTGAYGSNMSSWTANVGSELFDLPAGALGIAAGLEYRKVSGYDTPDQMSSAGYTTDLAAKATRGSYDVKEAYAELEIPLLKDLPAAERLSLNLASRYSKYSNFGSTTNSKGSVQWRPMKDLLVRGTIAEGFRAPSLDDTFGGGSQSYDTYLDPCDTKFGAAASDPAVAARCIAAGVPADFRQVGQSGLPIGGAGGAQTPFPFQAGAGNASLQPETTLTKTIGFVFNPSEIPGLTIGLDWYRISIDDRITAITANEVLKQCFVQGVQTYCDAVRRDPVGGQVTYLERGNTNLGKTETSGVDIAAAYNFPVTEYGKFGINMNASYVTNFKTKAEDSAEWVNYAGEYPYYKNKTNIGVDWSYAEWGVSFTTHIYSSVKSTCWDNDPAAPVYCSNPTGSWSGGEGVGYNKLGTKVYNDLLVSYTAPWKGKFLFGINNLFDKKPVINFDSPANAAAVDPDLPFDRFFFVRYTQQF